MREVVVSYLTCGRCGSQGCYVEDNRGQGVISFERWEMLSWCGCEKRRGEKAVHGQENWKVQQEREVVRRRLGEPSKC